MKTQKKANQMDIKKANRFEEKLATSQNVMRKWRKLSVFFA